MDFLTFGNDDIPKRNIIVWQSNDHSRTNLVFRLNNKGAKVVVKS
jgi:hypothetical protein